MPAGSKIQKLIVELEYRSNSLKNQVDKDMAVLKSKSLAIQKKLGDPGKYYRTPEGGALTDEGAKLTTQYKNDRKAVAALNQEMGVLGATTKKTMSGMKQSINENKTQMKKLIKPFEGYALSMMFFGMAIQKVFTDIWKTGQKTFQDVMHSVEGTVTGFDMLDGSVKYLGFTLGAALEPLAVAFIPIIDSISDWISNNEQLSRTIFVVGTTLGGILFLFGILKLGITGLISGLNLLFGVDIAAKIMKSGGLLVWLATKIKFVAAGATAATAAMALLTGVSIVAGIAFALVWLYKLGDAMGGFPELVKSVARGILNFVAVIAAVVWGILAEALNAIKSYWNFIVSSFEWAINLIISGLQALGIKVNQVDFGAAKFQVYSLGGAFQLAYADVMELNAGLQEYSSLLAWLKPSQGYATGFENGLPTYADVIPATNMSEYTGMSPYTGGGGASNTQVTQYNNITIEGTNMTTDEIMKEFDRIVTRKVGD